jgi:hypothetical protein
MFYKTYKSIAAKSSIHERHVERTPRQSGARLLVAARDGAVVGHAPGLRDRQRRKLRECLQRINLGRDGLAVGHEVGDDAFVGVQVAFAFTQVADVVTLRQDSPDLLADAKGVRRHCD